MTPPGTALLFFVKYPAPGKVKSRLASELGAEWTTGLYRAFVEDILHTIDGTGIPCHVAVHSPNAGSSIENWLGRDRHYLPQEGADLGERMANAFRAIFAAGAERAVLIGSDIPDLPASVLTDASNALESSDAVVGPARDGGYYLIGFRKDRFLPEIFRGITWSRPDVFDRTRRIFQRSGTSLHVLSPWQDVDTIDDLRGLLLRNAGTAFAASRTMQYLRTIPDRFSITEEHHGKI